MSDLSLLFLVIYVVCFVCSFRANRFYGYSYIETILRALISPFTLIYWCFEIIFWRTRRWWKRK